MSAAQTKNVFGRSSFVLRQAQDDRAQDGRAQMTELRMTELRMTELR
jgi:hypothetical protein